MLKSFAIRNFQSFQEQVQISLELNRHTPLDNRSCKNSTETQITKALAIIGANASGKTTLIKSLAFLDWFLKHSFQNKVDGDIPVSPHFSASTEPSEFEVEFDLNGKDWRYRLVVDNKRVYSESLYCKQSRAFSYVFTRDWNPGSKNYTIKQQQFGLIQREAEKVRENASLISTAAQYDVPLALEILKNEVFSNLFVFGRQNMDDGQLFNAAAFYANNEAIRSKMAKLLKSWDLGLHDVTVQKQTITRQDGGTEDIFIPYGVHKVGDKDHQLMLRLESSGTQGAYLLLSKILPALEKGALVVIDELEADLHPFMLRPILDLFFSPKTNPLGAQIIFTCHSIEVLSLLHKSQVVLVEKNQQGVSDAWRLDTVKGVRADDNLYAKYMSGAYGAVPEL